jgi:hypothetical protein
VQNGGSGDADLRGRARDCQWRAATWAHDLRARLTRPEGGKIAGVADPAGSRRACGCRRLDARSGTRLKTPRRGNRDGGQWKRSAGATRQSQNWPAALEFNGSSRPHSGRLLSRSRRRPMPHLRHSPTAARPSQVGGKWAFPICTAVAGTVPGAAIRTGRTRCRARLLWRRDLWCDRRRMIVPREKAFVLRRAPAIDNPLRRGPDLSTEYVKQSGHCSG